MLELVFLTVLFLLVMVMLFSWVQKQHEVNGQVLHIVEGQIKDIQFDVEEPEDCEITFSDGRKKWFSSTASIPLLVGQNYKITYNGLKDIIKAENYV